MRFDREEYARQCRKVTNTPLYRADVPPADELASLRDDAIEKVGSDLLAEYIADGFFPELILENDYSQDHLIEMCAAGAVMMQNPTMKSRLNFAMEFETFIDLKIDQLAADVVDA